MRRSLATPFLLLALLAPAGCGVVQDTARAAIAKTLGEGAASVLGEASADDAPDAAGPAGSGGGLSIAADESAAEAVVPDDESGAGGSGFYKIVEANGTVRFTSNLSEVPVDQRPKAERLAMAPSRPSAARRTPAPHRETKQLATARGETDQPPAARARSGSHEVVLYTTSWCGWCKKTRSWLDGKGVDYVDKDVESDGDAAEEMRDLVGGDAGVPVVVIDGEVIRGFDQKRMAALLEI